MSNENSHVGKITGNGLVMTASSLEAVLRQARALCTDSGLDPDQVGIDGKPTWLQFVDHARKLLKKDQQSLDPLQWLKTIEGQDCVEGSTAIAPTDSPTDPLDDLQKRYEKDIAGDGKLQKISHAPRTGSTCADPLELLQALERNTPEPIAHTFENPFLAFGSDDPTA